MDKEAGPSEEYINSRFCKSLYVIFCARVLSADILRCRLHNKKDNNYKDMKSNEK